MAELCDDCGFAARTARGLAMHRAAKHPPQREGDVLKATDAALAAAAHLTDEDAGAVAVLRDLAMTIDGMDERDPEAPLDNVTIPTYLRYAEALGLTPASRAKLGTKEERRGSKLAELRSIRGGQAS